jgi:hypothetical protein
VHWQPYRISLSLASAFPLLRADQQLDQPGTKNVRSFRHSVATYCLQAFRSDTFLHSPRITTFLFSCGDEFCSDVFMEFFFVLCYKLATMLWQGWWQHNIVIGSENAMKQLRAATVLSVCLSVVQQQKNA